MNILDSDTSDLASLYENIYSPPEPRPSVDQFWNDVNAVNEQNKPYKVPRAQINGGVENENYAEDDEHQVSVDVDTLVEMEGRLYEIKVRTDKSYQRDGFNHWDCVEKSDQITVNGHQVTESVEEVLGTFQEVYNQYLEELEQATDQKVF